MLSKANRGFFKSLMASLGCGPCPQPGMAQDGWSGDRSAIASTGERIKMAVYFFGAGKTGVDLSKRL